jgi:hypothetical protein
MVGFFSSCRLIVQNRSDLTQEEHFDYLIAPRPYMDSATVEELRLKHAVVIQCYARGMFARTEARRLRQDLRDGRINVVEVWDDLA